MIRKLIAESGQRHVDPFGIAQAYAVLGEKEQALKWLEKAYERRCPMMAFTKVMPWFDRLRSDPRFQNLMRRMNFPPKSNSFAWPRLVTKIFAGLRSR